MVASGPCQSPTVTRGRSRNLKKQGLGEARVVAVAEPMLDPMPDVLAEQ